MLHHISILTDYEAIVFQSLKCLTNLIFGKAKLVFIVPKWTLEHVAFELLTVYDLLPGSFIQCGDRSIPIDDFGEDDETHQVGLPRGQLELAIPGVWNDIPFEMNAAECDHGGG